MKNVELAVSALEEMVEEETTPIDKKISCENEIIYNPEENLRKHREELTIVTKRLEDLAALEITEDATIEMQMLKLKLNEIELECEIDQKEIQLSKIPFYNCHEYTASTIVKLMDDFQPNIQKYVDLYKKVSTFPNIMFLYIFFISFQGNNVQQSEELDAGTITSAEVFTEMQTRFILNSFQSMFFKEDQFCSHINFLVDIVLPQFILQSFAIKYQISLQEGFGRLKDQVDKIEFVLKIKKINE